MNQETILAIKASIALISSFITFAVEMFLPPTYFLAKPVAKLVAVIFSPFLNVSTEGTYIIVGNQAVDFVDTCVGIGYVILISIFLWIKGFSLLKILGMTILVFLVNLLRIGFVLSILNHGDFQMAALAHNVSYILFTLIAMSLILYAVIPIFQKSPQNK